MSIQFEIASDVPQLVHTVDELRQAIQSARRAGRRIGLVPTMGALHEGHLSLVRAARRECDFLVVTIFVNPTQFGPHEDLDRYPRTLAEDVRLLAKLDVELVFAPENEIMYPAGCTTCVEPPQVANSLEGDCRPGHFRGVATVVLKLLNLIQADYAYFGRKDYQQALVIRHMVKDLNVPMRVVVCPTVRDADGLAMSSRNRYLSPAERNQALAIVSSLENARRMAAAGERDAATLAAAMRYALEQAGIKRIDYATIVDADSLQPIETIDGNAVALIAAQVGKTRLIDNCLLAEEAESFSDKNTPAASGGP